LESFTDTSALVPLNDRALPNFPVVVQLALTIVPVLTLPDESLTVPPDPSSNPNAAAKPAGVVRSSSNSNRSDRK
jgi:hypothetical protein